MKKTGRLIALCLCLLFATSAPLAAGDKEDLEIFQLLGVPKEALEIIQGGAAWHLRTSPALSEKDLPFVTILSIWQHKVSKKVYFFRLLPDVDGAGDYVMPAVNHDTLIDIRWHDGGNTFSWANQLLLKKIQKQLEETQKHKKPAGDIKT